MERNNLNNIEIDVLKIPYAYWYRCIYEFFGENRLTEDELKNFLAKWNIAKWVRPLIIEGMLSLSYLKKDSNLVYANKDRLKDLSVNRIIEMGRPKVRNKRKKYNNLESKAN